MIKRFILLLFLIPCLCWGDAGLIGEESVHEVESAGGTTVTIGTTMCGGADPGIACDYAGSDATYLDPTDPDTLKDTEISIPVDGNEGEALVYLDLSAFITAVGASPAVTITGAKLYIWPSTVDNSPASDISIFRMLTAPGHATVWTENNVTYNEKDASGDIQWGGDTQAQPLSGTDYTATAVLIISIGNFIVDQWNSIEDSDITALVQDWYDGDADNYGIYMTCDSDFAKLAFYSEDYGIAYLRFYWEITYQ